MDPIERPDHVARAGLLLVAHGSRVDRHADEVAGLARAVVDRVDARVAHGFIELAQPAAVAAGEQLIAAGVTTLVVAPLLLFSAYHAREDVPAVAAELSSTYPRVRVAVATPLGADARLLALAAERAGPPGQGEALVVVSSGSSDADAQQQAAAVAIGVAERSGHADVGHAFASVARPDVETALREVARRGASSITVVSWSLFDGRLVRAVQAQVQRFTATTGVPTRWAGRLGPDTCVAEVVVDRYLDAARSMQPRR